MRRSLAITLLVLLSACQGAGRATRIMAPLGNEGEVHVYLDALPPEAARLGLAVDLVAVSAGDAAPLPLEVLLPEVSGREMARQRLLAWGRLPPGNYGGLVVRFRRATLRGGDETSDLLVAAEPARVALPLAVGAGRGTVVSLALDVARSMGPSHQFTPVLTASVPGTGVVPVTGYCTNTAMASVTVFDRHARRALALYPVGREPEGIALDAARNRAFVALAGDDQVELIDLATGTDLGRVMLRTGDRPRELALTPDGRQLLVLNEGSNSLAFVDAEGLVEVGRVQTGLEPRALLLDRSGRRAYALSRRSNAITVVDVAYRAVVATFATEAEPVRAQVSRAGDRLYVIMVGSPYMVVYGLPGLAVKTRIFVGLGGGAVKVDPRSDLVYVASRDDGDVQLFDPLSTLPFNRFRLPGGSSYLTIDDVENALVALVPEERTVAYLDLASRRVVGQVECGLDPYQVAVVGER